MKYSTTFLNGTEFMLLWGQHDNMFWMWLDEIYIAKTFQSYPINNFYDMLQLIQYISCVLSQTYQRTYLTKQVMVVVL